LFQERSSWL